MLSPYTDLPEYGLVGDVILARIMALLQADSRVASAWLSGSFGRGEADEWADFDLHVAIADEQLDTFLARRQELYRRIGRPILVQQEMAGDSMPASTFQLVLFPGPVEVDWSVGPVSRAVRPLAHRMLVDRVPIPVATSATPGTEERRRLAEKWLTFFWAMAPIALW